MPRIRVVIFTYFLLSLQYLIGLRLMSQQQCWLTGKISSFELVEPAMEQISSTLDVVGQLINGYNMHIYPPLTTCGFECSILTYGGRLAKACQGLPRLAKALLKPC